MKITQNEVIFLPLIFNIMTYNVKHIITLFFRKMKSPRRLPSLVIHCYTVERKFPIMHYVIWYISIAPISSPIFCSSPAIYLGRLAHNLPWVNPKRSIRKRTAQEILQTTEHPQTANLVQI